MFQFNDQVRIKDGFHKGVKGLIIDYKPLHGLYLVVLFTIHPSINIKLWISPDDLEKINEGELK